MTLANIRQTLAGVLLNAIALASPAADSRAQHVHPTTPSSAPTVGAAAIPFELKSLDGKTFSLDSLRGRPLVLNFFASWCDPCREEMPIINDLAAKAAKENFALLGIAVDDSRAAVSEFAKELKLPFPIALDLNSTVKRAYRIFGPPATFFIDGQGVIRDIVLGPITAERAQQAGKKIGIAR
ncbi:MAG: TlpA family protein disulfide reductase [Deltaproteobacteria bacterium]|nr:TlpA family protein disulfide reductase [Deltaproteobacteria bacterium]